MKPAATTLVILALLMAFLIAGCGKKASHAPETAAPIVHPFADVAGTYVATVIQSSGEYIGLPVNSTRWITIAADGDTTIDDGAGHVVHYGIIRRMGDGSFATVARSIPNGEYETATAPADLSTAEVNATRFSVLYGRVRFTLVKVVLG